MSDFMKPIAGNKMVDLRMEINDLRELLAKQEDEAKKEQIRKTIREKETYYNILADQQRIR